MKTIQEIKTEFQLVEDNLGLAINDLNIFQEYRAKQDAEDVLKSLAVWYENNSPNENVVFRLDIAITAISTSPYINRIHAAFLGSGFTFTLYCIGGQL